MIPKDSLDSFDLPYGCSVGARRGIYGAYICHCEDHCSWVRCHLHEAPDECLLGTGSILFWDSQKKYWVAQVEEGTIRNN